MKMIINPLYELIAQGEHQQQDFKYCINDSRKIARSLVAFANTEGGRLLIGVKDNGKITGVKTDEEYYMVEAAANTYSKPKIKFEVQHWEADGKMVLEINVKPSTEKPHFAQNDNKEWVVYVRKNDENVLANNVLIESWKIKKNSKGLFFTLDEPRKKLIEHLTGNETVTLSKYSKIAQISHAQAARILSELLSLGCIDINIGHTPVIYSLNSSYNPGMFDV